MALDKDVKQFRSSLRAVFRKLADASHSERQMDQSIESCIKLVEAIIRQHGRVSIGIRFSDSPVSDIVQYSLSAGDIPAGLFIEFGLVDGSGEWHAIFKCALPASLRPQDMSRELVQVATDSMFAIHLCLRENDHLHLL